jgi:transcriptional regulator with XRE-family HTH domain
LSKKDNILLHKNLTVVGECFRKLRIEAGYTSYESFAYDMGLEPRQYFRLESGANMTLSTFFKLLDYHQLTIAEFGKKMNK